MTRFLFAVLFALPSIANALPVPAAGEAYNCIYTVTPSTWQATQVNSTTYLDSESKCKDYSQVCLQFTDSASATLYVSTSNVSVAAGGTIPTASAWPVYGRSAQCFDWFRNIAIWVFQNPGETPAASTVKVLYTR